MVTFFIYLWKYIKLINNSPSVTPTYFGNIIL